MVNQEIQGPGEKMAGQEAGGFPEHLDPQGNQELEEMMDNQARKAHVDLQDSQVKLSVCL